MFHETEALTVCKMNALLTGQDRDGKQQYRAWRGSLETVG